LVGVVSRERVGFAPPYFHPSSTGSAGAGNAVLRLTVDTLGQAEPGSPVVLASDNAALSQALCRDLLTQHYYPAQVSGQWRRTRGNIELHFTVAGAPK
jgi:hypothetical protein